MEAVYVNYADSFEYQGIAEPLLNQELFMSFGEHFQMGCHSFESDTHHPSVLIGNRLNGLSVKTQGAHFTAGVIFKPWGLFSACGLHGKCTVNRLLDPTSFKPINLLAGVSVVKQGLTPADVLELLEARVRNLRFQDIHPLFDDAFQRLNKAVLGQVDIRQMAAETGISQKTFIDLFNKHIGISPLKYLHAKTVIRSLKQLRNPKSVSLTQVALEHGFFDQPHFIRVFKSHMGMTPLAYRKMCSRVNFVQS